MYRKDNIKASVLALSCACLFQASDAMNGTVPNGYNSNTVNDQSHGIKSPLAEFGQDPAGCAIQFQYPPHVKMDPATSKILRAAGAPAENNIAEPNRSTNPGARNRSVSPAPITAAANPLSVSPAPIPEPTRPDTPAEIEAAEQNFLAILDDFTVRAVGSECARNVEGSMEEQLSLGRLEDSILRAIECYKSRLKNHVLMRSTELLNINSQLNAIESRIIDIEDAEDISPSERDRLLEALAAEQTKLREKKSADLTMAGIANLKADFLREMGAYLNTACHTELPTIRLNKGLISKLAKKPVVSNVGRHLIALIGRVNDGLAELGQNEFTKRITANIAAKTTEIAEIESRSACRQLGALITYTASAILTTIRTAKDIGNEENSNKISNRFINWLAGQLVQHVPHGPAKATATTIAQCVYHLPLVGVATLAVPYFGVAATGLTLLTVLTSGYTAPVFQKWARQLDPIHRSAPNAGDTGQVLNR